MRFSPTPLSGLVVIEPEPIEDKRGVFARVWCEKEFAEQGLSTKQAQFSISRNHSKGTVRGIHFQRSPFEEDKLVRCERGAIFDVAVDLRQDSPTFGQHYTIELNEENMTMLFIPKGFGHGFQTLCDKTQIIYQISQEYAPGSGSGIRYDDPELNIVWPLPVSVISEKDLGLKFLSDTGITQ